MKILLIVLISLGFLSCSEAGEMNQAIVASQQARQTTLQQQGNRVHNLAEQSLADSQAYRKTIEPFLHSNITKLSGGVLSDKSNPQAILFVSLGMPTQLLQQYLREGHDYHVPLVIRGLLQNNMPLTLRRMKAVLTLPDGTILPGGIVIDPVWFQHYAIQRVPTLVINTCPGCGGNEYDSIAGNLSLHAMLDRLEEKGQPATQQFVKPLIQKRMATTARDATANMTQLSNNTIHP